MIRKFLIIVVSMILAVIVLTVLTENSSTSDEVSVSIRITPSSVSDFTIQTKDTTIGVAKNPSTISLKAGNQSIIVTAKGFKEKNINIDVSTKNNNVNIELESIDSPETVKQFINKTTGENNITTSDGLTAKNITYFENETWVVGTLYTSAKSTDGEIAVLKKVNNTWIVVLVGTSIDEDSLRYENVPETVIKYLDTLR